MMYHFFNFIILSICSILIYYCLNFSTQPLFVLFPLFILFLRFRIKKRIIKLIKFLLGGEKLLKLWGFSWTLNDFCRHWGIYGKTGSAKTVGAINNLILAVIKTWPDFGGYFMDVKGDFYKYLVVLFNHLGIEDKLRLFKVPSYEEYEEANGNIIPEYRVNILMDKALPETTISTLFIDTATACGQKFDDPFFVNQGMNFFSNALTAFRLLDKPMSLQDIYNTIKFRTKVNELCEVLEEWIRRKENDTNHDWERLIKKAQFVRNFFRENYLSAKAGETLENCLSTLDNVIQPFLEPAIHDVVFSQEPNCSFDDLDKGKVFCLSIPQEYLVARNYVSVLFKNRIFLKARMRFAQTKKDEKGFLNWLKSWYRKFTNASKFNLLWIVADEAQQTLSSGDSMLSEERNLDILRSACVSVTLSMQMIKSGEVAKGDKNKFAVIRGNSANGVFFTMSDYEDAETLSKTIGKEEIWRETTRGTSGQSFGNTSTNKSKSLQEKYKIRPSQLVGLKKFGALVRHCEQGEKFVVVKPRDDRGKVPDWYYDEMEGKGSPIDVN